jgi:hypothetical protein
MTVSNTLRVDFGGYSFMFSGMFGVALNFGAENVAQSSAHAEKIGLRLHSQDERYVLIVRPMASH